MEEEEEEEEEEEGRAVGVQRLGVTRSENQSLGKHGFP